MKKAISALMIAFMLVAGIALAGLKDIPDAGAKGEKFRSVVLAVKTFKNTHCVTVAGLEADTGVDLKTVTDNQIQNFFSVITLSAQSIAEIKAAAIAIDGICEYIELQSLPATD